MRPLWIIILCGGAIVGLAVGIRQTFGLFLTPISQDLALGREVFAFSIGLVNLLWGFFAPFAGAIADRYGTARVVWAMSLARSAGYTVPDDGFQKAVAFLRDQVAKIDHGDYESQAILLHGLTTAGWGDFALANRLYRSRPSLSSAALAHLALAFAAMHRKATAEELLALLAERNLDAPPSRGAPAPRRGTPRRTCRGTARPARPDQAAPAAGPPRTRGRPAGHRGGRARGATAPAPRR